MINIVLLLFVTGYLSYFQKVGLLQVGLYICLLYTSMKDGKISHSGTQEEIIQSVPVKVWSCVVANNEVEMWQKQFRILRN